jgi:hypothetical protein
MPGFGHPSLAVFYFAKPGFLWTMYTARSAVVLQLWPKGLEIKCKIAHGIAKNAVSIPMPI